MNYMNLACHKILTSKVSICKRSIHFVLSTYTEYLTSILQASDFSKGWAQGMCDNELSIRLGQFD
jgi:hypothetical protein